MGPELTRNGWTDPASCRGFESHAVADDAEGFIGKFSDPISLDHQLGKTVG